MYLEGGQVVHVNVHGDDDDLVFYISFNIV